MALTICNPKEMALAICNSVSDKLFRDGKRETAKISNGKEISYVLLQTDIPENDCSI